MSFDKLQLLLKRIYQVVIHVQKNQRVILDVDVLIDGVSVRDSDYDLEFVIDPRDRIQECPYQVIPINSPVMDTQESESDYNKYKVSVLGGTFDYLHPGHKILLTMAAYISSQKVICGVSELKGERLEKKQYYEMMQPLQTRIKNVTLFLKRIKKDIVVDVVPIQDDYGPTKTVREIDCIVGSLETFKGCQKGKYCLQVNELRKELGMNVLDIKVVDCLQGDSEGKVSSTDIRRFLLNKGA